MARIRCFLIEETDRTHVFLRRYRSVHQLEPAEESTPCPLPENDGYHQAMTFIGEEPVERNERGYIINGSKPLLPNDDPRWPTLCACGGYTFTKEDHRQRFTKEVYRRADTGDDLTLRDAPAGAMWYAWWYDDSWHAQGPHVLVVRLPDKTDWIVDADASNCNYPDGDRSQEHHHCWPYRGTPPDIDVDKSYGPTCTAGAGSIASPGYHGFLRHGYLEN